MDIILETLRDTEQRGIVDRGWGGLGNRKQLLYHFFWRYVWFSSGFSWFRKHFHLLSFSCWCSGKCIPHRGLSSRLVVSSMFSCGKPSFESQCFCLHSCLRKYYVINEAVSCVVNMQIHHGGAGTTATGLKAGVKRFYSYTHYHKCPVVKLLLFFFTTCNITLPIYFWIMSGSVQQQLCRSLVISSSGVTGYMRRDLGLHQYR